MSWVILPTLTTLHDLKQHKNCQSIFPARGVVSLWLLVHHLGNLEPSEEGPMGHSNTAASDRISVVAIARAEALVLWGWRRNCSQHPVSLTCVQVYMTVALLLWINKQLVQITLPSAYSFPSHFAIFYVELIFSASVDAIVTAGEWWIMKKQVSFFFLFFSSWNVLLNISKQLLFFRVLLPL